MQLKITGPAAPSQEPSLTMSLVEPSANSRRSSRISLGGPKEPLNSRHRDWLAASSWTLLIFAGIPLARRVQTLVAAAIEPLVYLAEQGMGLAYLPDYAVSGSIAAGRLVATLDAHVRHAGVMRALWPASRYPAPKVRAFVDYLAKNLLPQRE